MLDHARTLEYRWVSSYVPWRHHQTDPGQFDFRGETAANRNLVRFIKLIAERGLLYCYRPGPFTCNEDIGGGLPDHIILNRRDISVWDSKDELAPGYQIPGKHGHQPSYMHPDYLKEVRIWLAAADEVIRPFSMTNGGPVGLIGLDNEVSYIVQDSMFGSDYNPHNLQRYRSWLRRKYGTIDKLPYRDSYRDFDAVQPPRELQSDVEPNLAWYTDWVAFKEDTFRDYLAELRSMHAENGLGDLVCFTNLNAHHPRGSCGRGPHRSTCRRQAR